MDHIKYVGALLVLFASTWVGLQISFQLKQRPQHIRQLIDALTILEAEMLYSQLSLQDAFFRVAKRVEEPAHSFFHQLANNLFTENQMFNDHWDKQLEQFMTLSFLDDIDKQIIKQFGQTLGQHDYEQQEKNIRLTITYLQRQREEAIKRADQYSKLAKMLGILCGLFIILLLL